MAGTLLALTLRQPWAYAITDLGKDVENRTWRLPTRLLGARIAIHAGGMCSRAEINDAFAWMGARGLLTQDPSTIEPRLSSIVATVRMTEVVGSDPSPWFMGPWGWKLSDLVVLREPIKCPGKLGLWAVPQSIADHVRSQEQRLAS